MDLFYLVSVLKLRKTSITITTTVNFARFITIMHIISLQKIDIIEIIK